MSPDEAMAAFAAATELPVPAIRWALDHWDEAGPRFLDLLERYADGTDRSDKAADALFFAVPLLAERRATAAFQPLLRLMRDPEAIDRALGDAVAGKLPNILISIFDGDLAPLIALAEDGAVDEFQRSTALEAIAFLTGDGRQSDAGMRALLMRLSNALASDTDSLVWAGWIMAVANLGYADLAPVAEEVIRKNGALAFTDLDGFRGDLARTLADPDRMAGFDHDHSGPFVDAIGTFERMELVWGKAADEDLDDEDVFGLGEEAFFPLTTHVNPLRHVGRNDPCPCGSGKKYKKCCLGRSPL